jgi:hypothetical protein
MEAAAVFASGLGLVVVWMWRLAEVKAAKAETERIKLYTMLREAENVGVDEGLFDEEERYTER